MGINEQKHSGNCQFGNGSPPRLAVRIGRIEMKNPVTVASGTFGFGQEMAEFYDLSRLGAITVKGTSLHPWRGNDYPRTVETPSGLLNAIGLQNDGVDSLINEKLPFLRQFDVPVIVNVVGHTVEEYAEVAARLDDAEGVHGLELNISCPNVKEGCLAFGSTPQGAAEVVAAVRRRTKLTLITKLSPNVGNIVEIARAAVDAGSDALSLINTLLGTAIDPWTRTFRLANKTGGLSGPAIKPVALRMVWEVAQSVDVPIIGMGGIMNALDAVEFLLAGARAVAVGTANFVNPMAAVEVIDGIAEYLQTMGISDVNEIVGSVA
ncbi:MAG: dihydroorotate dehydrogenase [Armatimonadota bacterium]|nr:dihydroorotate dehydrogenase [Armatimonadota bacterium]